MFFYVFLLLFRYVIVFCIILFVGLFLCIFLLISSRPACVSSASLHTWAVWSDHHWGPGVADHSNWRPSASPGLILQYFHTWTQRRQTFLESSRGGSWATSQRERFVSDTETVSRRRLFESKPFCHNKQFVAVTLAEKKRVIKPKTIFHVSYVQNFPCCSSSRSYSLKCPSDISRNVGAAEPQRTLSL